MIEGMARKVVRVSRAETIRDIDAILERVRRGMQIIVEDDSKPVAIIRPATKERLISECLALAKAHGSTATLDPEFSKDLEDIINRHREPLDASRWD